MFASIRRHQNIIWFFVVIVVIISFVVFFSPTARIPGHEVAAVDLGSIDGRRIDREEYTSASHELQLYIHLNSRPEEEERIFREMRRQLDDEIYRRLVIKRKLKDLKIEVGHEAIVGWIRDHFGDPVSKAVDVNNLKRQLQPFTFEDLERLAEHEVGKQQLVSVFGLSGKVVSPQDAEELYRRENQPVSAEAAVFSISNYLAAVTINSNSVAQFYTNNMPDYRIPQRVQVAYLRFDTTNAALDDDTILKRFKEANPQLAGLTNLNEAIEKILAHRGTNALKDEMGNPLSPIAARSRIHDDLRKEVVRSDSQKKAMEFINDLFEQHEKNPADKEILEKLAAAKGLTVGTTSPFDERNGPKEFRAPAAFPRAAFALTDEEPYSSTPVVGEDALFVLGLKRRLQSEVQPLDTVRAKVILDFQRSEAARMAREAGEKFQAAATNGIAQGKAFSAIATEQKVKTVKLPPFSPGTRTPPELDPAIEFSVVQNLATRLNPGQTSSYVDTEQGGLVIFLKERLPIDEAKLREELPAYLVRYREQRQLLAFNDWFRKQEQTSLIRPQVRER